MQDYSNYPNGNRYYSGAERKRSILINEQPYLVKFQKNSREGLRFNHVSEYLGSHIFALLGMKTQKTFLGTYKGENVVVIQDFLEENEVFVPFNDVGDSSLEQNRERYQYSYEDIIKMLQDNIKLTNIPQTIDLFWDMFIIDALIANFDRHGSNWGFVKKDNQYRLSPIFDNGSSLFPQLNTDEKIETVLANQEEIDMRIYKFSTSQVRYQGKKSSYYEIISSLAFEKCNHALIRIVERINLKEINKLIDSIECISEKRKEFYKTILKTRYEKILLKSYDELILKMKKKSNTRTIIKDLQSRNKITTPIVGTPSYVNSGIIKVIMENGEKIDVAQIDYQEFNEENFQYVISPFWNVIDSLSTSVFQGIPGIDMNLRLKQYYRVNYVPIFITERTPSENRQDLWELLESVGLDYYDRFEWLLRTTMRAANDNLIVERKC